MQVLLIDDHPIVLEGSGVSTTLMQPSFLSRKVL